eukprot:CAMPEP_0175311214 /NCGR_PEP_ID=MMETSP0093-20121207/66725_1 /TAXON_ID=311494 /ORGANISM="Alexandrium monilatum, Strain CCMP3105" /LENGTH=49 /DNA_ID= /DNA_START= /DNA_END= /DNA_ORIENTATION=
MVDTETGVLVPDVAATHGGDLASTSVGDLAVASPPGKCRTGERLTNSLR